MEVISNNPVLCTIALAALEQVTDPEIGLNVVDLGLIYQLDFDEAKPEIHASMTLTTRFCPMGDTIYEAVKRVLKETFKNYSIQLELCFSPAWTAERISPAGKEFLNR